MESYEDFVMSGCARRAAAELVRIRGDWQARELYENYLVHWQLGLDLNQPAETRQGHRRWASHYFSELRKNLNL